VSADLNEHQKGLGDDEVMEDKLESFPFDGTLLPEGYNRAIAGTGDFSPLNFQTRDISRYEAGTE